jgi:rhamnosyltransferase
MGISVIIPTLNAGESLVNLLSSLMKQDLAPMQVIVIDSSSEDNTASLAKRSGAETFVIPRKSFNHGGTRNFAASKARGDILVFMTQDAMPGDQTLLRVLTDPLRDKGIAATFGRHVPKENAAPLESFSRLFNYPEQGFVKEAADIQRFGIKTFFFSNVCSAFKKGPFTAAGMFPEGIRANEDMLITAKLILSGYKVAYVPEAVIIHSHAYSLRGLFRRYYNIGSSLKNNNWILRYAKPEGEGIKFMKEAFVFVMKQHQYRWIPYIFLESVTKYAGYRMGLLKG